MQRVRYDVTTHTRHGDAHDYIQLMTAQGWSLFTYYTEAVMSTIVVVMQQEVNDG